MLRTRHGSSHFDEILYRPITYIEKIVSVITNRKITQNSRRSAKLPFRNMTEQTNRNETPILNRYIARQMALNETVYRHKTSQIHNKTVRINRAIPSQKR